MSAIELIKPHIQGHNRFLTDEVLNAMTPESLLGNAHPIYRGDYARAMLKEGIINKATAERYATFR